MSENFCWFYFDLCSKLSKIFFFPHRILGKKVLIPELWVNNESFHRCHIFLNRNTSFWFNANKIWIKFKFNIFVSFRSYISTIIYHFVIAVRYIFENLNKHASSTGLCTIINNWRYQLSLQCKQWHKKVIVLRNCNKAGDLVDLKISAKYLQFKPWVLLSVRQFDVKEEILFDTGKDLDRRVEHSIWFFYFTPNLLSLSSALLYKSLLDYTRV